MFTYAIHALFQLPHLNWLSAFFSVLYLCLMLAYALFRPVLSFQQYYGLLQRGTRKDNHSRSRWRGWVRSNRRKRVPSLQVPAPRVRGEWTDLLQEAPMERTFFLTFQHSRSLFYLVCYIRFCLHVYSRLFLIYTAACFLSDNIYDYYNVSQGKITIPGMDDGEEFALTDVRSSFLLTSLSLSRIVVHRRKMSISYSS